MPRWITIAEDKVPFDYRWPDRIAITEFKEAGDHFVKDELADFAVAKGYATEGKSDAKSRSTKGGGRRKRKPAPGTATDHGRADTVDRPALADDAGAAVLGAVDAPAGER